MTNSIKLLTIKKNGKRVKYIYELEGEWSRFFLNKKEMVAEYDMSIESVPESILSIPFVGSILPLVWLQDATLYLKEIDEDYYNSLSDIKDGYINMIPELDFKGNLIVSRVVRNSKNDNNNTLIMFSGGVDAYTTFFKHLDEKPTLLTIWGADIQLKNIDGWENVYSLTKRVAKEYGLKHAYIKSNFREFLDENALNESVKKINDGFWHALQHSIAMLSHVAPYAYLNNIGIIYIASSYPQYMIENERVVCASDPRIDNKVNFCETAIVHDGTEFDRQGKINYLVNNAKRDGKQIELRVCFLDDKGINCCRCEKCYRTILQLISEGESPKNFGFDWDVSMAKKCKRDMKYTLTAGESTIKQSYPIIKQRMIHNKDIIPDYEYYEWFEKLNIEKFNNYPAKVIKRSFVYRGMRKVLRIVFMGNK